MKSTDVFKSFRVKRNMTQEQLAKMLEISRQTYNTLENNLLSCDCLLLFKLLNILQLTSLEEEEFFDVLRQDYLSYKNEG